MSAGPISIRFDVEDGDCRATYIHTDEINPCALAGLLGGKLETRRASHVEPDPANPGQWTVDLSPVGGPYQGGFVTRAGALYFETTWIEFNIIRRAER